MKHLFHLSKPQFLTKIYNYEARPARFIYEGTIPSVVIFGSTDNRFCREFEPSLEILAKKHKNHYHVYYVNTAEEPELKKNFASESVPVVYLCPVNGEPRVLKDSINIREIARLANKMFASIR